MTALLVALGAALGAPLRLLVGHLVPGPRGTLAVNVAGSALLGLAAGSGPSAYAFVGVGFCGALTTFSTFALEAVDGGPGRPRRGPPVGWTVGYVALTVTACLGAAAAGLAVMR
ncbi:MAG: crcB [Frankiales bacterium]|nr:crcB [Frankiales bacterium]